METRANHLYVGIVTLLLLAAAAVFFVWLAQLGNSNRKEYDIFFDSVGGLANGSQVSFAGVPAGQVSKIELWPTDPDYVRVRVEIDDDIPILQGTVASISASFTGVSNVALDGAVRGAPAITEPGPEGVPVIPTKPGALGEILNSAPLLLERLATLADRLTRVLDDDNQTAIAGILANSDRISGELANSAPQVRTTLDELEKTLTQSTETLAAFEKTLEGIDGLVERDGQAIATDMRATLASAREAAAALEATLKNIEPVTQQLSQNTLPAANATLRDLRQTSETLRNMTETIETQGAGSLVSGRPLPEYKP